MRCALPGDFAQSFLIPYLKETEHILSHALREFDQKATCQIIPAADLCFPHDVMRLCGGFATGCLVVWDCAVPIVPIDTNVNIDTSSIFWLNEMPELSKELFLELRARIINNSSYEWNFHKGNHFISLTRRRSDGKPALIIHSNEKEFKYQYNGLSPTPENWYMDSVRVVTRAGRFIRLLVGRKAELFYDMAKLLEPYNVIRHRFIATQLLGGVEFEDEHHHHYYMPDRQSVAMGCYYQCEPEVVPVFSAPGNDIALFEPAKFGVNSINRDGSSVLLVPHGWGKTMKSPVKIETSFAGLKVNDRFYVNEPEVSLGRDPRLTIREFSPDPYSQESLFYRMRNHTPGRVIDSLQQVSWFNKDGFCQRNDPELG